MAARALAVPGLMDPPRLPFHVKRVVRLQIKIQAECTGLSSAPWVAGVR